MILVVDDHADTREVLTLLLRRYGYEAAEAASGPAALAFLAERADAAADAEPQRAVESAGRRTA